MTESAFLFGVLSIVIILLAVNLFFTLRAKYKGNGELSPEAANQLQAAQQEIHQNQIQQARLEQQISTLQEDKIYFEQKTKSLQDELSEAGQTIATLKQKTQIQEETLNKERELIDQLRTQMKDQFTSLASQALEGSTKQFLELAKSHLTQETQKAQSHLDQKEKGIENLVKPLKETLSQYQEQIQAMENKRSQVFGTFESELQKLASTHQQLSAETTALKDALKKPHVRGRWGEVQLKNCIEIAGMSEFCDVTFQDNTEVDDARLIPDMTVRMPGGRMVIVDAKTPIEAFLASLDSKTEEDRNTELIRHGRHVREHVQTLSRKAYGANIEGSADFTVMFLPNESFLYAALETQTDLMEYAIEKKVLIATPPTLVGLLKVIRYGWNEETLAENAKAISETGIELHKRILHFVETYESVGKQLERATKEYDAGFSRLKSRVLPQVVKLEKLGAKSSREMPESLRSEVELLPDSTSV